VSYDHWKSTEPDVFPSDDELSKQEWEETHFPCACGDPDCIGYNDDAANIKLGSAWYASDCVLANHHPLVVASRELDDLMNRSRR
jgi:hypothetical protein